MTLKFSFDLSFKLSNYQASLMDIHAPSSEKKKSEAWDGQERTRRNWKIKWKLSVCPPPTEKDAYVSGLSNWAADIKGYETLEGKLRTDLPRAHMVNLHLGMETRAR